MKRMLCLFLSLVMVLGMLAGCGGKADAPQEIQQETQMETQQETTEVLPEPLSALELMLADADALRQSILNSPTEITVTGTSYYVSNSGNDANDGLTPETAWATVEKVSNAELEPGDAVLFERGDVFREHVLYCQKGVTYSAYGEGPKPVITGSPENGADPEKWTLYGETADGGKVWLYHRNMRDCGTLVLNGDTGARKIAPYWDGSDFVTEDGQPFDVLSGLKTDLSFFSPADSLIKKNVAVDRPSIAGWTIGVPLYDESFSGTEGALYFRCDEGNPGEVFESIEFAMRPIEAGDSLIYLHADNVIDNLNVFANAACGFMHLDDIGTLCQIQNCEISFCGGYVLFYDEQGRPEMAGDGMNIQRPCVIANNYIHHNADNGITCEYGDGGKNVLISELTISRNLFEYNHMDIQVTSFDEDMKANGSVFRDILVEDNYMLYTSDGWSNYIHSENGDYSPGGCIKCGDFSSPLYSENLVFRNNILYSETARSFIYGGNIGYEPPVFENNTLYMRPYAQMPQNTGAVALWANDEYIGEEHTEFLWIFDDSVWPEWFSVKDWNMFLNEYLGTGNTLVFVDD